MNSRAGERPPPVTETRRDHDQPRQPQNHGDTCSPPNERTPCAESHMPAEPPQTVWGTAPGRSGPRARGRWSDGTRRAVRCLRRSAVLRRNARSCGGSGCPAHAPVSEPVQQAVRNQRLSTKSGTGSGATATAPVPRPSSAQGDGAFGCGPCGGDFGRRGPGRLAEVGDGGHPGAAAQVVPLAAFGAEDAHSPVLGSIVVSLVARGADAYVVAWCEVACARRPAPVPARNPRSGSRTRARWCSHARGRAAVLLPLSPKGVIRWPAGCGGRWCGGVRWSRGRRRGCSRSRGRMRVWAMRGRWSSEASRRQVCASMGVRRVARPRVRTRTWSAGAWMVAMAR